jgi:hypothetical protein
VTWPPYADHPLEEFEERKFAHCDKLVLPRRTTPAAQSFPITIASRGTFAPIKLYEPAVFFMESRVAMLLLSSIGIPCSALRIVPFALSASRLAAIVKASGLISVTAWRIVLAFSVRALLTYIISGALIMMERRVLTLLGQHWSMPHFRAQQSLLHLLQEDLDSNYYDLCRCQEIFKQYSGIDLR